LARYLGAAYGQSHIELGPELVEIVFDPSITELGDDVQEPVEEESVGGALVIKTTCPLDSASLEDGLVIERLVGNDLVVVPRSELAIGTEPEDETSLLIMSLPAWARGEAYRITLTSSITDEFERVLQIENDFEILLVIPEDGVTPPKYRKRFEVKRDNKEATANSLGGRFPGGQNLMFQGAWTDLLTGLAYHRARWYDPRNSSWLSQDPEGDVDSQNLYAFVGHKPNIGIDPLGEKTRVYFDESTNTIELIGFIEFFGKDGNWEIAGKLARDIEMGWTKKARRRNGEVVNIKTKIYYQYSLNGEMFRYQDYDQILLYRDNSFNPEWSQMNLEDPVTGAPSARLVGDVMYRRSIAGGVSVGRINLDEREGSRWGNYPGVAAHEWGHAIGFWYHSGPDFSSSRSSEQIEEYARESPGRLDPMRSARIPPADYIISSREVEALIDFAESQRKEHPAYVPWEPDKD